MILYHYNLNDGGCDRDPDVRNDAAGEMGCDTF